MYVRIERNSRTPITRQLADQIRAQCLSGKLMPGTQLPSVRELARELAVNQNTVLRVYERLAAEKLLDIRHGEGTFVALDLPTSELQAQRVKYRDEVTQLVRQGRLLGYDPAGLRALLNEALIETEDAAPETLTASPTPSTRQKA
jgi:GntR family transcriptional regulator